MKYTDSEIVELYQTLGTQAKVSEALGISTATVCLAMKRAGAVADGFKRMPKPQRTCKHGTRTMYNHGCRCEACSKAEHEQYLKRTIQRVRTNSKWGEKVSEISLKAEQQKTYNKKRYEVYVKTAPYRKRINWQEVSEIQGMKCAVCGKMTNPNDVWLKDGRKCFGRDYPTVDHILPLKRGGTDSMDNVQLLCKQCNSKKGAS